MASTSNAHNTMAPATAGTPECSIEYMGLPYLLDDHRPGRLYGTAALHCTDTCSAPTSVVTPIAQAFGR